MLLAPEMSSTILSCLETGTDIAALMNNIAISGPGIKFLVDNEAWDVAAWACESSCFANNPTQHIGNGLGELEIKPESLIITFHLPSCGYRKTRPSSGFA
jgi:hypothetical protein